MPNDFSATPSDAPAHVTDRCRMCPDGRGPPTGHENRFPLKPCACAGTVHRECFYRRTNESFEFKLLAPLVPMSCDQCNTAYPFRFPRARAIASYGFLVSTPAAYYGAYKLAALAGGVVGLGPWVVLGAGTLLTAAHYTVRYSGTGLVRLGDRAAGHLGCALAGVAVATLAPLMAAGELQFRIMRTFHLRGDPPVIDRSRLSRIPEEALRDPQECREYAERVDE